MLWGVAVVCPIYRMHGAYLGSSGTSVLYIGCVVPIWGVAVVCPIYRLHGAYLGSSGTSVLYIGCMVPILGVAVVCPIYRMHGAHLGSSGTSVLFMDALCLKVKKMKFSLSISKLRAENVMWTAGCLTKHRAVSADPVRV